MSHNSFPFLKENSFRFHVIQEDNFEDTFPYIDEELLVVCDGCGGAGSSKHILNIEDFNSYEKIRDLVLPEDQDGLMKEYMTHPHVFAPIINCTEKKKMVTSAFLGSRIALSRFVYAYKTLGHDAETLRNFVYDGFKRVIEELHLDESLKTDAALLATTLVAIALQEENEKELKVDVYWAGDSRAYYLNKDGVQKLVIDDEEEGGGLVNLFAVKKNIDPVLNKREYVLAKPCALFTCSDGLFDSVAGPIEVENVLLHFMINYGTSMDTFAEGMKEYYDHVKNDDTTIALRSFGYSDYNEFKEAHRDRLAYVEHLYIEKTKYGLAYNLRTDLSEYEGVIRLLADRAFDMKQDIIEAINNAYDNGVDDPFIKKFILREMNKDEGDDVDFPNKELVNNLVMTEMRKSYGEVKTTKDAKTDALVDVGAIFATTNMNKDMKEAYDSFLYLAKQYYYVKRKKEVVDQMHQMINWSLAATAQILHVRVSYEKVIMGDFISTRSKTLDERVVNFLSAMVGGKELLEEYEKIVVLQQELKSKKGKTITEASLAKDVVKAFKKFVKYIENDNVITYLDQDSPVVKEIVASVSETKEEEVPPTVNEILDKLYFADGNFIQFIRDRVSILEACCFDDCFTLTTLNHALDYERAKLIDPKEVDKYIEEYNAFLAHLEERIS